MNIMQQMADKRIFTAYLNTGSVWVRCHFKRDNQIGKETKNGKKYNTHGSNRPG